MPDAPHLYPLKFAPIYKAKVWGGRTLEKLGRVLPGDEPIGESWELVDLATTSVSGGGGGAERSRIINGPLCGKTFAEVIDTYGKAVLGDVPLTEDGGFPLLLKFLDASENLSVQVHPSPAYAADHDDAFLKSEAWYIVNCKPGSVIYKGIKQGTTPDQLRAAIQKNTDAAVVPLMVTIPVRPGDCHYLPSGTCHALGAGILVAEVQTPSDTTYRVYDWGRTGRELHVEQAMQCIEFSPAKSESYEQRIEVDSRLGTKTKLVECEFFRIDRFEASRDADDDLSLRQPEVWMFLEGAGQITCGQGDSSSLVSINPGDTVYLPPAMPNARATIHSGAKWLQITFPQVRSTLMA